MPQREGTLALYCLDWAWLMTFRCHLAFNNFRGSVRLFCLFGVLRHFQHCAGHITTGSWKGRGNQYIEFARVVYCKLPTNSKQLPAFPLEPVRGSNPGLKGGSVHLILILMLSMFQGS